MTLIQFGNDGNDGKDSKNNKDSKDGKDSNVSKPVKRIRWATKRSPGESGARKRLSILNRHKESISSGQHPDPRPGTAGEYTADEGSGSDQLGQKRTIYMNTPLPAEDKDEQGHIKNQYVRNKIRTAKYTPLSFIPKNLWFQFHNVAMIYFFAIIILSIFSIFGASNAGLGSVPLIVIITLTAIKDGIEDWRRTVLDNELNNSPVYRLVDWDNVNSSEDNVSLWRRIKKASTRTIVSVYRTFKRQQKSKTGKDRAIVDDKQPRPSGDTRPTIRTSIYSDRTSFHSTQSQLDDNNIQMTPVPSPKLRPVAHIDSESILDDRAETSLSFHDAANGNVSPVQAEPTAFSSRLTKASSKRQSTIVPKKDYGSILDNSKRIPEKARFKRDFWKNVQVGDFVRVYNDEQVPADLVVLSTSDPDGACYVETKNLDGETNLKVRQALQSGRRVRHARDCERTAFIIESEGPLPNLYQYSARAKWQQRDTNHPDAPPKEMSEPININNMLLRGCNLKNTEWVLGVVIFTGQDTKIMLNAGLSPRKRARMARNLNWNVIYNFVILFFMCLVSGIVQGVVWSRGTNSEKYFEFGAIAGSPPLDGFVTFWSAIILFQNLVPISLYITLEIVRLLQAFFIYSDVFMYYDRLDYPCTPKSWNISDDLGQIEYIFSDKTGTLTQNVMEFKKCTINGTPYGEAYTEAEAGLHRREGIDVEEEGTRARAQIAEGRVEMLKQLRTLHDNPYLHDDDLTFVAPRFVLDLKGESGKDQQIANEGFMVALALCHTVITEMTPGDPPRLEFKAQSPDEAALVATARDCGFTVLGRSGDDILLNVLGEERRYRVLNTLEFNSTRKRMSAIVRMPSGQLKLFCKGADSMIYSRLVAGQQSALRKATAEHLEMFAREGLRTLCIAERDLDEDEYQRWNVEHDLAAQALQNREDKLDEVADQIERNLMLLGGTAIEDRLQDGVPDTIALLGDAGIKLWILTGDKVETAINIGFSCNLLSTDMELLVFDQQEDIEGAADLLNKHLQAFGLTGSDEELAAARLNHEPPPPTHAVVIDGDSLKLVLQDELRQRFLLLCKQCRSVLCCRVSPAQKAAVVQLVKAGLDVMALAIGDGANDVAMIQEADVGVGIAGEEGRQAVMSSDYAIGQFRYLQRLVLVHGRWSYRRLAESIANFFYKNMVWTFALFWYQIYNNCDVTYLFDYSYVLLVNLVFTSFPVGLMGVLDQDVSDKVSLAVPQLYRRGMERKEWTEKKFWLYMLDGMYQSAICFFMGYLLFAPATPVSQTGKSVEDRERMGVFIACSTIAVVNLYILLNTYRWDWIMGLVVAISILLIWTWTGIYTSLTLSFQFYKAAAEVYGTLNFWALCILIITICLLPRFSIKAFQKHFFPLDIDIVREQVRQGKFDYLDQFEAYVPPTATMSASSSESNSKHVGYQPSTANRAPSLPDSQRPIYPPSEAPTSKTRNQRSQNGSDGTDQTKLSLDIPHHPPVPATRERVRPSYERARQSLDRLRPSFEGASDFTSAALLTRIESSHSASRTPNTPSSKMRLDITDELQ